MSAYKRLTLLGGIVALVLMLTALMSGSRAYEASHKDVNTTELGVYVVQSEGDAPEICFSVAKSVKNALEMDPDVVVTRITFHDGFSFLLAKFGDGSGAFLPITPPDMVCGGISLKPHQLARLQGVMAQKIAELDIVPVWPQQEE